MTNALKLFLKKLPPMSIRGSTLQLLGDMMDKCGHAFRLQVAKKILPRLQVPPSPAKS